MTQLITIQEKLVGLMKKISCPIRASQIPARDIFLFPNFLSRTGQQKVTATIKSVSVR